LPTIKQSSAKRRARANVVEILYTLAPRQRRGHARRRNHIAVRQDVASLWKFSLDLLVQRLETSRTRSGENSMNRCEQSRASSTRAEFQPGRRTDAPQR
jgi:hypothetical protein